MTFQPPVTCPICRDTLAPDRSLEDHLVVSHTHREVVRHFVSQDEQPGLQSISD